MSSIAFNSKNGTAYVRGADRHMMASAINQMMMIAVRGMSAERIVQIGAPDHYLVAQAQRLIDARANGASSYSDEKRLSESLETFLAVGGDGNEFPGYEPFTLALNTALKLGGPILRLAARIHGQCEIHLWFDQEDAPAIATLIEDARKIGFFRAEMGWESVLTLLRTPDVGDVVLSYSVTDSFPNGDIAISDKLPPAPDYSKGYNNMTADEKDAAGAMQDDRYEAWEEMPADERWDTAMAGLRAQGDGYKLTAEHLLNGGFYFGDGAIGFDFAGKGK